MAGKITADELARELGMSSSSVSGYQHGNVIAEERNASDDKDLCLLVVTAVPASLEKAWEFVTAERFIEVQEATLSQGHIDLTTFSLEGLKFDHGSHSNITSYAMSSSESSKVSRSHDKEAAFKEVLSARAKKYWEHGLKGGIDAYKGNRHDPADDLNAANRVALKVIHDPILKEEIQVVPAKSKHPEMHSLTWSLTEGKDMTSIVLTHNIRYKKQGEAFFTVARKFYSGCDFDASQIVVGVVPTSDDHSAVFYVNHTYSAQVAGFGGGMKKSIGRKIMKEKLVATMKKAQKVLAKV